MFPETKAEGNIEVERKHSPLPAKPVIKCFLIRPNSKNKQNNCKEIVGLTPTDTHLPQFQGARPDHLRVESSSCCFSWENEFEERPHLS